MESGDADEGLAVRGKHYDPAVLVDMIRDAIGSMTIFPIVGSDVQTLVQPVLNAYEARDPMELRQAANFFLEITESDLGRENAYNSLLTWRDQPPDASVLLTPPSWLTDSQNERLERAFRAHDWDAIEGILGIDIFPRLRVLVRRLQIAVDAQ